MILLQVLLGPPVAQPPLGIVNVSEFVKAVTDFVSHTSTRRTVIGSRVAVVIEIGWLQDAGRKELSIGAEHNDRPDSLRIYSPLDWIGRFFEPRQIARMVESLRSAHITDGIATHNVKSGIVNPFVRISHAYGQR